MKLGKGDGFRHIKVQEKRFFKKFEVALDIQFRLFRVTYKNVKFWFLKNYKLNPLTRQLQVF